MPNVKNVLLVSKQKESAKSQAEAPSAAVPVAPTMGHKIHSRRVTSNAVPPNNNRLCSSAEWSPPSSTPKSPHQEVTWHKNMLEKVKVLEENYADQYSPKMDENGVIHSAKVMIPKVNFSKVKPHILRNLPKPGIYPLHGCSPDPDFYHKATESYDRGWRPKFDCTFQVQQHW